MTEGKVLVRHHHSSRTGTDAFLVAAVDPQIAVMQVETNNSFGHPHQYVLEALAGREVLRDDLHGQIHVQSDRRRISHECEKGIGRRTAG